MTVTLERMRSSGPLLPGLDPVGEIEQSETWHGLPVAFVKGLATIAGLALGVRAIFILGFHQDFPLSGDAWVYHHEARYIGNGDWFIQPVKMLFTGEATPAADHPPAYILVLAVGYVLGVRAPYGQMLINAAMGVATVVLIGLIARRIGGNRVGLVAALLAAIYPNLWAWNGQVLSESLSALMVATTIFFAYRFLDGRRWRDLVLTAAMAAIGALSRSELILLLPLLVLPMVVGEYLRTHDRRQAVKLGAIAAAVAFAVMLPWTAFNLSRFHEPVLLGNGLGRALDSGACPDAFTGYATGFWKLDCLETPMGYTKAQQSLLDESQLDKLYRDDALRIYRADPGRVPIVLAARVGRTFQVFAPMQQLDFDQLNEGREWWVSSSGWATFYVVAGFGIAGVIALRRQLRLVYPLIVPIGIAALGSMIAFGTTRYRAPAEPMLVILAAFGTEWLVQVIEAHRRSRPAVADRGAPASVDRAEGNLDGSVADDVSMIDPKMVDMIAAVSPARRTLPIAAVLTAVALSVVLVGGLGTVVARNTGHDRGRLPEGLPAPPLPG